MNKKIIFFDFDGVIKDSVDVKTQAFYSLFEPFDLNIAEQVKKHHEANGGMSRFDKFPLYLKWAGQEPSDENVAEFCERFGQLVLQGVINSPWVKGVEYYLRTNTYNQLFIVVSATPQEELEYILKELDLYRCFEAVFGAPIGKSKAIKDSLNAFNVPSNECLMIGDAVADLEAAQTNNVPFLLRKHTSNLDLIANYEGPSIYDFTEL